MELQIRFTIQLKFIYSISQTLYSWRGIAPGLSDGGQPQRGSICALAGPQHIAPGTVPNSGNADQILAPIIAHGDRVEPCGPGIYPPIANSCPRFTAHLFHAPVRFRFIQAVLAFADHALKLSELQGTNHVTGYFKLVRDTDAARAEFQRFQQLAALG